MALMATQCLNLRQSCHSTAVAPLRRWPQVQLIQLTRISFNIWTQRRSTLLLTLRLRSTHSHLTNTSRQAPYLAPRGPSVKLVTSGSAPRNRSIRAMPFLARWSIHAIAALYAQPTDMRTVRSRPCVASGIRWLTTCGNFAKSPLWPCVTFSWPSV